MHGSRWRREETRPVGPARAAQPRRLSPTLLTPTDELGERSVADDGRLLNKLRSGSLTPRMADGADAVSLRFCNAIGGAVVSSGAGVALADRRKRNDVLARTELAPARLRLLLSPKSRAAGRCRRRYGRSSTIGWQDWRLGVSGAARAETRFHSAALSAWQELGSAGIEIISCRTTDAASSVHRTRQARTSSGSEAAVRL